MKSLTKLGGVLVIPSVVRGNIESDKDIPRAHPFKLKGVANYAWNSNSDPGNESRLGAFTRSAGSAAVAASKIYGPTSRFFRTQRVAFTERMKAVPNILKNLKIFRRRNWYHFFPVDQNIGSNDIFEVTEDFCKHQCTHMKGPVWYGDCKPRYLNRTLLWYNSDPKTTLKNDTKGENNGGKKGSSGYANLYMLKKGGWQDQSRRTIWRDFPPPQQNRVINVTDPRDTFSVKSIGKIDLKNQGDYKKSISENALASSVCSRLRSSENRISKQDSPWIKEKDGVQLPFHHKLIWGSRDLTDEEIRHVIRSNWRTVGNTARVNGKKEPVFCDLDTRRAHANWEARGARKEDTICNVFYVENAVKSKPAVPHVHVFILREIGSGRKGSDGERYGSHREFITRECSWSQMVRGKMYSPHDKKLVDGEIALFDSQARCFGMALSYSHGATLSEATLRSNSPSCVATLKAQKNPKKATCVNDYLNKLHRSGRQFPETDFDFLMPLTMMERYDGIMEVRPKDLTSNGTFSGKRRWALDSHFGLCDRKCVERDGFTGDKHKKNYTMFKSTKDYIRYIRKRNGLPESKKSMSRNLRSTGNPKRPAKV